MDRLLNTLTKKRNVWLLNKPYDPNTRFIDSLEHSNYYSSIAIKIALTLPATPCSFKRTFRQLFTYIKVLINLFGNKISTINLNCL